MPPDASHGAACIAVSVQRRLQRSAGVPCTERSTSANAVRMAEGSGTGGIRSNGIVGDLSAYQQPAFWLPLETDAPSNRERHIALSSCCIDDKW